MSIDIARFEGPRDMAAEAARLFGGGLGHFKIGPGHPLPRPNHPWSVPLGWLGRGSGWLGDSDQT